MINMSHVEIGNVAIELTKETQEALRKGLDSGMQKLVHIAYETARVQATQAARETFEREFAKQMAALSDPMGGGNIMHMATIWGVPRQ